MKNIVIFLQNRNFFGTQITHIPLLEYLRKTYPDASIILFSKHKISNIFLDLNLADELILEKNKMHTLQRYKALKADMTITLRRNSTFITLMMIFFNRNKKIGFSTPITNIFFQKVTEYDTQIYRANNYLNLLDSTIFLHYMNKCSNEILLMPGAGGKHKIWDLNNYINLAIYLQKMFPYFTVSFVLGTAESSFIDRIKSKNFTIYFNEPLQCLTRVVQNAQLVVANDCGPSHLAHIYDTPRIILLSNEFNDASSILIEWFLSSSNAHYIVGKKSKSIDTIQIQNVQELCTKVIG